MLHEATEQVKEFHVKHGFTVGVCGAHGAPIMPLKREPDVGVETLHMIAAMLESAAQRCEEMITDRMAGRSNDLMLRAHLMLEELGEVINSLAMKNEEALLDGLCDLIYVIIGTAVTYDLPLPEGFTEVCRSNRTKRAKSSERPGGVHPKGPGFIAPDLRAILEVHGGR